MAFRCFNYPANVPHRFPDELSGAVPISDCVVAFRLRPVPWLRFVTFNAPAFAFVRGAASKA